MIVTFEALTKVLADCVAEPSLHARLLNTFAYLEHIGARKIHRFQRFGVGGAFVLKHAAEESRHAWHFKRQIDRFFPHAGFNLTGFTPASILGGHATRSYLRRLDLAVNRHLRDSLGMRAREQYLLAYLLVTYLIELRADELYPCYAKVLKKAGIPVEVQSVINEEHAHLADMRELLAARLGERLDSAIAVLSVLEARLFTAWLASVAGELTLTRLAEAAPRAVF